MRSLIGHIVPGDSANHQLVVKVIDLPSSGGACHHYEIKLSEDGEDDEACYIDFQEGPIGEVGVNGLTHEALLVILIDRMEGFQAGPYASENNAAALQHMKSALEALQQRTRARIARGVEGTHIV
jgi:hypothetical protein